MQQNRNRPKLSITVSPESYEIIQKLSRSSQGAFIDECINAYLTGDHMGFVTLKYGMVDIKGVGNCEFWVRKEYEDRISPFFNTINQALNWLSSECPELKIGK